MARFGLRTTVYHPWSKQSPLYMDLFMCLFLAVLGLPCYRWAFLSPQWLLLLRLRAPGVQAQALQSSGLAALWHVNLSVPEVGPGSPPLAGGFLTTGPPGKTLRKSLTAEIARFCLSFSGCFPTFPKAAWIFVLTTRTVF